MSAHIFGLIVVMALVVIALRAMPFVLFPGGKNVPRLLLYLGGVVTAAAIAMLVVYSFYGNLDYPNCSLARLLPGIGASLLTVALHWFFKNPLVSIIAGTALFMMLIK